MATVMSAPALMITSPAAKTQIFAFIFLIFCTGCINWLLVCVCMCSYRRRVALTVGVHVCITMFNANESSLHWPYKSKKSLLNNLSARLSWGHWHSFPLLGLMYLTVYLKQAALSKCHLGDISNLDDCLLEKENEKCNYWWLINCQRLVSFFVQ